MKFIIQNEATNKKYIPIKIYIFSSKAPTIPEQALQKSDHNASTRYTNLITALALTLLSPSKISFHK